MKWPFVKLGQVARIRRGASPRPKGDPRYFGGPIPWLKIGDVPKGRRFVDCTEEGVTEAGRQLSVYVEPGSLLLSNSASVGRPVITRVGLCIHDGWLALSGYEEVFEREFLYWFFVHAQRDLARLAPSGVQANLNTALVNAFAAPVPAKKEQRRIVALLEQADDLRRQRSEADALAEKVLPALFRYIFGEPSTNPKHWPTRQLHTLATFISGATPSKEVSDFWNGTIPWVSPKDMKQPELSDALDHVSAKALDETNLKLVPAHTPLIVVRGMILAHTVPVCLARVPVTINQDMKALAPKGHATPEFLQWALLAQHGALLRLVSTAAHGTRKLDTDALGTLEIPTPPPNQAELLRKWTNMVQEQQNAARTRNDCGQAVDRLWNLLLYRAFTGDLTAKWRQAHMKEILAEMEQQARLLNLPAPEKN